MSEDIPPRIDNASEADSKVLKGHLMGAQKARENFVKKENDTKLKSKKGRIIRLIYRVGDLMRCNKKNSKEKINGWGQRRSLR